MSKRAVQLIALSSLLCLGQLKVLLDCKCGQQNVVTRVVNGKESIPNKYPWMVALVNRHHQQFCGGALINSRWVLTAAHCVDGQTLSDTIIGLGAHDIKNLPLTVAVDKIIMRPDYGGEQHPINDLALVRMSKPVPFSRTVSPACLPPSGVPSLQHFENLVAAGWGDLKWQGSSPRRLQEVDFNYVTYEKCVKFYGKELITKNHVCVAAPGKDVCQGDSGGPLMTLYQGSTYVVGVASFSPQCSGKSPAGYMRVTPFLDWIRQTIKEGDFCQNPIIADLGFF